MVCVYIAGLTRNNVDLDDAEASPSRAAAKLAGVGQTSVLKHRRGECVCDQEPIPENDGAPDTNGRQPRILTIDIESKPMISAHWGLWKQNIGTNSIIDHGGLLCFAAKWYGEKDVMFSSEWDHGHHGVVQAAWNLIDEADILVTYNGIRYDARRLNNEFLLAGLPRPRTYKHVDLFKVNKKMFDLPSRKLDYLAQRTVDDHKTPHTGMQLWMDVMNGDKAAQELMETYNIQDVALTERVFDRLRGWLGTDMPHMGMWTHGDHHCPACGTRLSAGEQVGTVYANVQAYTEYRCPKCQALSRSTQKTNPVMKTRAIA